MRFTFAFVLAALLATSSAQAVPASQVCPAPQPASNMTMTLDQEFFQGQPLDTSIWTAVSGNPFGDPSIEAETYVPAQVSVVNQRGLRFTAATGSGTGAHPYKSGAVSTLGKWSQLYGHFEFSARMPQENGMWPAGWGLLAKGTWPPELDIIEYIYAVNGHVPDTDAQHRTAPGYYASNLATTTHWGADAAHHQQSTNSINDPLNIDPAMAFQDWKTKGNPVGYHTYAIDWRPGSAVYMIDGAVVFCSLDTASTGQRVASDPMYLIFNLAISNGTAASPGWAGDLDPSKLPQTMDIANVRAYRYNDLPQ